MPAAKTQHTLTQETLPNSKPTLNAKADNLRTPSNEENVGSFIPLMAHAGAFLVAHNTRRCSNRLAGWIDLSTLKKRGIF